jgi:hypothetical protein
MYFSKKLPLNTNDGRYKRPIDGLRAMVWYQFVKQNSMSATYYQLSKNFGGSPARWAAYEKGSQPNDLLLNLVDKKIIGSKQVYLSGLNREKLWPAICSTDISDLKLIEEMGGSVDKLIADFRLRAINKMISFENPRKDVGQARYSHSWMHHPFDFELDSIQYCLSQLIGPLLASHAINILREEIKPYREKAEAIFFDSVLNRGLFPVKAMRHQERENAYFSIQMGTVKNKGMRLG